MQYDATGTAGTTLLVPTTVLKVAGASIIALGLANCASPKVSKGSSSSREIGAFSDPKYGKASPRVVGMDEDAPKGGGRYQVGKPYMVAGKRYVPREKPVGYTASGHASWYGVAFHGRKTANGEIYDRNAISAAHPTMPLPSYARVTNLTNNHSIIVRVNDRGPYHGNRVMDVSERTATLLNFKHMGTARVKIDYLGPAALAGSDDGKLVASLNRNGPATAPAGGSAPTMVASVAPVATARPTPEAQQPSSLLSFSASSRPGMREAPVSRPAPEQSGVITETKFIPVSDLPVPPARPFDLETIGGAAGNAAPVQPAGRKTVQGPSGSHAQKLSFIGMEGGLTRFSPRQPSAKVGAADHFLQRGG